MNIRRMREIGEMVKWNGEVKWSYNSLDGFEWSSSSLVVRRDKTPYQNLIKISLSESVGE